MNDPGAPGPADPEVAAAAARLAGLWQHTPRVAVVLGSGLGAFADRLEESVPVPYADIPHFPRPTVSGHAGRLVLGKLGDTWTAVMQGRIHLYEGLTADQVTFGVQVFAALGVPRLVLTTASGGIHRHYRPGDFMLIEDQLNLQMRRAPRITTRGEGEMFRGRGPVYSPRLIERALTVAHSLGLTGSVHRGVFAGMMGPTYETPAEIRMVEAMGADAVSMSTVLEATTARALGMEVLGLSAIVNPAAGLTGAPLNHAEVLDGARKMEGVFLTYLAALIPALA